MKRRSRGAAVALGHPRVDQNPPRGHSACACSTLNMHAAGGPTKGMVGGERLLKGGSEREARREREKERNDVFVEEKLKSSKINVKAPTPRVFASFHAPNTCA